MISDPEIRRAIASCVARNCIVGAEVATLRDEIVALQVVGSPNPDEAKREALKVFAAKCQQRLERLMIQVENSDPALAAEIQSLIDGGA